MHVLAMIAADNEGGNAGGGLIQIGILLLIPLAMYFLMIRPQRRRMREQQAMQSSLEVGDEVVTASGIYGFITGFEDDIVWVEIDEDVQVRVNRGSLQGKARTGTGNDGPSTSPATSTTPSTAASGGAPVTPSVKGRKRGGSTSATAPAVDPAESADAATEAGTDTAGRTTQE